MALSSREKKQYNLPHDVWVDPATIIGCKVLSRLVLLEIFTKKFLLQKKWEFVTFGANFYPIDYISRVV